MEVAGQEKKSPSFPPPPSDSSTSSNTNTNSSTNSNTNTKDDIILLELEKLRLEMNYQLEKGNINEARIIRTKLENLMKNNNIDYTP